MMDIKALLPPAHVVIQPEVGDRRALWHALTQPLLDEGIVQDADFFLRDLERRESQLTTRITDLVALPHARSNAARRLGLCLGILAPPGLRYDDDSKALCRVCFLIAIPAFAPTAHLPVLQHLAAFAFDPARVEKLMETKSAALAARQVAGFKPQSRT
ncbi:MAG: Heat-responsive suppressor HrsA [Lentisphaerae bacterium ADurb.BinA184]|nr:MAG: Heat-responsive suppressor HrsA [Lentisphaerae bacterium ADurb.BinA184]